MQPEHWLPHLEQAIPVQRPDHLTRSADKSLARPTFRRRRRESIVSLEANLLLRSNNICLLQTLKNL